MPQTSANGIQIEYETFGDPSAPPILLIMGLGAQLVLWPLEFCEALASAGFYVIRYDNRDVGLSSRIEKAGKPRLMRAGLASLVGLPVTAGYTLNDMAKDAVGLMDALELDSAHVVGVSMGGMIAQILAAKFSGRVRSLTLIMTTSGHRSLPKPSLKLQLRLGKRPKQLDRESLIRHSMQTWRLIGSPAYPADDAFLRRKVESQFNRALYPRGLARQTLAILASGDRTPLLRHINTATLVIHGDSDPLVPTAGGRHLAKHIQGAKLEIIPGMGHDLPDELLPQIEGLVIGHAQHTEQKRADTAGESKRRHA